MSARKQRVLFYGNCQIEVLATQLLGKCPEFLEKYELLFAKDYGLLGPWGYGGKPITVSSFDLQNRPEDIVRAVQDCDVFIFHKLKYVSDRVVERTTNYLHNEVAKGLKICLPSFWFSGYLTHPHLIVAYPEIFGCLLSRGLSNDQILHWFANETHPNIGKLMEYKYEQCLEELITREEVERFEYDHFISLLECIMQWKTQLLCFNHSHPTPFVLRYLASQLLTKLELSPTSLPTGQLFCPGADYYPLVTDLAFFREYFDQITIPEGNYSTRLTADWVDTMVDGVRTSLAKEGKVWEEGLQQLQGGLLLDE